MSLSANQFLLLFFLSQFFKDLLFNLLFQKLSLAAHAWNGVSWVFASAPNLRGGVGGCIYNLAVDAVHGTVELLVGVDRVFEVKMTLGYVLLHYGSTSNGYRN